jgi:hypothetical protein
MYAFSSEPLRSLISPDLVLQVMVEAGGVGVDISAP